MDSTLDALVKYVNFRNWTLYSIKILGPATLENILDPELRRIMQQFPNIRQIVVEDVSCTFFFSTIPGRHL